MLFNVAESMLIAGTVLSTGAGFVTVIVFLTSEKPDTIKLTCGIFLVFLTLLIGSILGIQALHQCDDEIVWLKHQLRSSQMQLDAVTNPELEE